MNDIQEIVNLLDLFIFDMKNKYGDCSIIYELQETIDIYKNYIDKEK